MSDTSASTIRGPRQPNSSLKGLRAYQADRSSIPVEVQPPPSPRRYWTRRDLVQMVERRAMSGNANDRRHRSRILISATLFRDASPAPDWPAFLDDFQRHWPTDDEHTYVDFVRDGIRGNGAVRAGNSHWRRLTEVRAGAAKSVFHFDVPGSVAKSTHAGLPWLRYLRQRLDNRVHFWPFDGWEVPPGQIVIAEVYPSLWSRGFPREDRTADQHDAYSIAEWMRRRDQDGSLKDFLSPRLTPFRAYAGGD